MAIGIALGGHIGIGTLAFVVGIGPLVHVLIPMLASQQAECRQPATQ